MKTNRTIVFLTLNLVGNIFFFLSVGYRTHVFEMEGHSELLWLPTKVMVSTDDLFYLRCRSINWIFLLLYCSELNNWLVCRMRPPLRFTPLRGGREISSHASGCRLMKPSIF